MHLEFHSFDELSPLLLGEISAFLDSQNTSHVFQFPQWNRSSAKYALLQEGGSIRWFTAFGVHSPLGRAWPWMRAIVSNRGPVCDDKNLWHAATEEFGAYVARDNYTYLDVGPDWVQTPGRIIENDFADLVWKRIRGERFSLRVDLTDSEDVIFSRFRKNSRYEVRHAERLRVSVSPALSESEVEEFLNLHSRLATRKGFLAESPEHVRAAVRWLIDDRSRGTLLLARAEDVVRGGAVIARSGKRSWYVWGATDNNDRFNVGHILQWKALLWAKAHGCDEYDFGGYTLAAKSGPAWFKAGFGGTVVRLVPSCRRVLRPGSYRIFHFLSRLRDYKVQTLLESKIGGSALSKGRTITIHPALLPSAKAHESEQPC